MPKIYDFSGYATKSDIKCTDGRIIHKNAFKDNDGQTVPLVWQHVHNDPNNVLGHAILEHREDGVYAYGIFNDTAAGRNAKILVNHGDITGLSIYANQLLEKGKLVHSGNIRELSLVLSGANPGALIDNLSITHADGTATEMDEEAIIYSGDRISVPTKAEPKPELELMHADDKTESETVGDVFNTLSDKQKTVVYAIIAQAIEEAAGDDEVEQSDIQRGDNSMKSNVFDNEENDNRQKSATLTHGQFSEILADAQKSGSFKDAFLKHVVTYGIEDIDFLFPDAKTITSTPTFIERDRTWVSSIMDGTRHSPFSRIKTVHADITAEEARALGYVKGTLKKEEIIKLLKRVTTPTTIYKKQKLDRDDILDITDLDVVAWLKAEMRVMLDEEVARAILIGDGRAVEHADKINEEHIRPIYKDDDMYAHKVEVAAIAETEDIIEAIIRARAEYKGSGNPTLFISTTILTDMLLIKDTLGRRIYSTQTELESALRVSKVVEVQLMSGLTRETDDVVPVTMNLIGIIVNPKDYVVGADKGGALGMFDDFDIDYNQHKYLLETRISGALTLPKSALIIEQISSG